jgi:hypothetical protein
LNHDAGTCMPVFLFQSRCWHIHACHDDPTTRCLSFKRKEKKNLLGVSPRIKMHPSSRASERTWETDRREGRGRGLDDWYLAMAHGRRKDEEDCTTAALLRGDGEAWKEEEWHHHQHASCDLWRRVCEESRKLWEVVGPAIFSATSSWHPSPSPALS